MSAKGGIPKTSGSIGSSGQGGIVEHPGPGGEVVPLRKQPLYSIPGRPINNKQRYGMCLGKMPDALAGLESELRKFRSSLEAAVLKKYGELSVWGIALVNEATMHEAMRVVAWRHVRYEPGVLPPLDVLAAVSRFTSLRNRALARLRLNELVSGKPEAASLDWDEPASDEAIDRAIYGPRAAGSNSVANEEGDSHADEARA